MGGEARQGLLETTFDCNGAILAQQLLQSATPEPHIKSTLESVSVQSALEKAYEEVKLNKPCPHCGEARLARSADSIASVEKLPVMPVYSCSACNKQSYYLTDEYLEFLVAHNATLFDPKEQAELEKDKKAFIHELNEYIIRIFATKHLTRIR